MKSGWTTVALGDVAVIERQGVNPTSLMGDTAYLGLEHIEAGGRIIGSSTLRDSAVASTKFRFTPEHVLFGKLRPYLAKIAVPNFGGVCSTDILPIRPGSSLDRSYLKHFLRQPLVVELAAARATGANLPRLSPSELARFEVPLPPIEEQRRIAAILDHAQRVGEAMAARLRVLEAATANLVSHAVRSSTVCVSLGDVLASGPSNGLYKPASAYGAGTNIVRIDSFVQGKIDHERLKRLLVAPHELNRFGLAPGDIVINRVNAMSHVGKAALIGALPEPMVYESNMMRVRVRDDWRPEFVAAWLMTDDARQQIRSRAKQAINQASINGRDVRALLLPVLSLADQGALVERLDHVDKLAERQRIELGILQELLRVLQSRAFRGEL